MAPPVLLVEVDVRHGREPEPLNEEDREWRRHVQQQMREVERAALERELTAAELLVDALAKSAADWRAKATEVEERLGPANARLALDEAERQEVRRERTNAGIRIVKERLKSV
jgi:hypothetical protein